MQNRRALLGLLSANFISGLAQGMSMISIPMHFAAQGQSDFFGLSYALMTLVTLFWAPYAGTLVDRYDRRRIFLLLNLSMGLLLLGISLGQTHMTLDRKIFKEIC